MQPAAPVVDLAAARQREEERMRSAAEYQEQDWQRLKHDDSSDEEVQQEIGDGTGLRTEDGTGGEIFECVACAKTFSSEASWENHERSKKHKQAVWRLRKEMLEEGDDLVEEELSEQISDQGLQEALEALDFSEYATLESIC